MFVLFPTGRYFNWSAFDNCAFWYFSNLCVYDLLGPSDIDALDLFHGTDSPDFVNDTDVLDINAFDFVFASSSGRESWRLRRLYLQSIERKGNTSLFSR